MAKPLHIQLTDEQARYVEQRIASGASLSADAVVAEAIDLLRSSEAADGSQIEALRALIQEGAEQLDRGEFLDGPSVMAEGRERLRNKANHLNQAS